MQGELGKRSWAMVLCLAFAVSGCQRQKGSDNGKTYTPDAKSGGAQAGSAQSGAQDGGAASGSGSQAGVSGGGAKEKPLNAPADTTNGKSSKASDDGSSEGNARTSGR